MEDGGLMNEVLTQGKYLSNQLKNHLHTHDHHADSLLDNILFSYEKALFMLTKPPPSPTTSKQPAQTTNLLSFKKRKTMGSNYKEVKLVEGSMVSDGYNWRKYGQKDILGANHPRAYYRCSHRNVQGCLATKQVQRSDEDTSVFEVTYKGRHTCIQATQALEKKPKHEENITSEGTGLGLFPSFSFASTPIETEKLFYFNDIHLQTSDSDLSDQMLNSTPNSPLLDWDSPLHQQDFYFDADTMFT